MIKKIMLLTLVIALLVTSFVFADDGQSALSRVTGLTDQEIQSLLQNRIGYGKILTASIVAKMTSSSIKDVLAANQAGATFAKIAEDKGIKLDAYKAAILKGKTDYVDEQVKSGNITEAQAKLIKERMQQRIQTCDGQGINQGLGIGLNQGRGRNGMHSAGRGFRGNGAGFSNSVFN